MHTDGGGDLLRAQHSSGTENGKKNSPARRGGHTGESGRKKQICAGLLAHVDAGKTTLAEAILYLTGRIRALGRVDHQDTFFDNFGLERARGITIFSKQAQVILNGKPSEGKSARGDGAGELSVTLLDTPGHADFSSEMERTLQVLDYAILVISAPDGVQSHVETLWRLLARYKIPVYLFINKMDLPGADRMKLMAELTAKLDENCVDFSNDGLLASEKKHGEGKFQEDLAMCDERLLEIYASGERIGADEVRRAIAARQVFPCYFGSALKLQGVEELLEGIRIYSMEKDYPEAFGARVFKISRDAQGSRLTHMKITGGVLHVKDVLTEEEKVNQIRILSGAAFETVQEARAGAVCAVTGLERTYVGEGLGAEPEAETPVLEPVLSYRIELPEGTDIHLAFRQLKQLEEEDPQLHITWASQPGPDRGGSGLAMSAGSGSASDRGGTGPEPGAPGDSRVRPGGKTSCGDAQLAAGGPYAGGTGEIHAQLMGEVQTEILQSIIQERFGLAVRFGEGSIVYRETITAPVVGMGHFEPLRHYAEVHLLLEPGERGSGLQFESRCSTDELDLNWQRLVMTHLEEKRHLGVLTGSEITDMKITLVAGRAHQKHTEGGDFRQATYRAVRQGLCRAHSILLEPVYRFRMEVPMESVGRALSDIQRMHGTAGTPVFPGGSGPVSSDMMEITGTAPVVTMRGYQSELLAYTRGRGRLFCRLKGYEECHNAGEVISARGYDPLTDAENPCGSVFCVHGAGFVVNWEDVPDYVHIADTDRYADESYKGSRESTADPDARDAAGEYFPQGEGSAHEAGSGRIGAAKGVPSGKYDAQSAPAADEELRAIFERTYGTAGWEGKRFSGHKSPQKRQDSGWAGYEASRVTRTKAKEQPEECLLVDGYNIIFAWDELKELSKISLESARTRLLDLMCNYQGYKNNYLIVVFDAYRVAGHSTEVSRYHNIYVVYTKEAETADQYIEKTARQIRHRYHVTVATSDALEQIIILGAGAARLSANGLYEEVERMRRDLRENYLIPQKGGKAGLLDGQEDLRAQLPPEGDET